MGSAAGYRSGSPIATPGLATAGGLGVSVVLPAPALGRIVLLDPIIKTIEVPCSQERAFGVFVNEINRWWPLDKFSPSANAGEVAKSLRMEPKPGGKIVEVGQDGTEYLWGMARSYVEARYRFPGARTSADRQLMGPE